MWFCFKDYFLRRQEGVQLWGSRFRVLGPALEFGGCGSQGSVDFAGFLTKSGGGGGEGGLLGSGMTVVGSGLGGFGPIV